LEEKPLENRRENDDLVNNIELGIPGKEKDKQKEQKDIETNNKRLER